MFLHFEWTRKQIITEFLNPLSCCMKGTGWISIYHILCMIYFIHIFYGCILFMRYFIHNIFLIFYSKKYIIKLKQHFTEKYQFLVLLNYNWFSHEGCPKIHARNNSNRKHRFITKHWNFLLIHNGNCIEMY